MEPPAKLPENPARERGRRDGKANILPLETGKEYMNGFWEGRAELHSDPMTLWRNVNYDAPECDHIGCDHH